MGGRAEAVQPMAAFAPLLRMELKKKGVWELVGGPDWSCPVLCGMTYS